MIVVDTNVIGYLLIQGPFTAMAESAARKARWCAPLLWRSELRNVLASCVRQNHLSMEDARQQMKRAEDLLWGREYTVRSSAVFDCIDRSKRSAYDCEFVALAEELGIPLITTDRAVLDEFRSVAIHLKDFAAPPG